MQVPFVYLLLQMLFFIPPKFQFDTKSKFFPFEKFKYFTPLIYYGNSLSNGILCWFFANTVLCQHMFVMFPVTMT